MVDYLTIGQLAERTGVQTGTLRMWEQRHDFPRAKRLPSGHRRYPESEAERVLEVVRARESGMSLAVSIQRAVQETESLGAPSIFAGLRKSRPELAPYPVPKRLLVPISHAMEDECSARGGGAVLVGSFQRETFYRQAEPRWRSFARRAELSVVLGDFPEPRSPRNGPVEIPIDRSHPLSREWAIVCDGPGVSACLAGWQRPGTSGDGQRVFEMLWSVEPDVVRDAARIGLELASAQWPGLRERIPNWLEQTPEADSSTIERATALTNRMLAYVSAAD
ncbi:MAG TPA: DICT sensory domain-containing protein [Thermoleophilaceae bacterium]|nr:DICT sensory domain-containing protein [Thermoleophilaceae bacterium]